MILCVIFYSVQTQNYFCLPYFESFSILSTLFSEYFNFVYPIFGDFIFLSTIFLGVFSLILCVIFYSVQTQNYFCLLYFGCILILSTLFLVIYIFLSTIFLGVFSSILCVIFYSVQTQNYFCLPYFRCILILSTLFLVISNFVYRFSGGFILEF